ncbi:helix-turn-helix domain-containing protein [Streptomyces murinus]|uniref:helix-turn-helix domain-containing protein n=1 Tax=Streptomyces murinus TaxID=33900 RepID=UPI00372B63F9
MNVTAARLRGRWFATVAETAEVLHVDPRTVYRAIDLGEIPAVRVGQQLRVPVAWLEAQAMLTESPPGGPPPVPHTADQEQEAAPDGAASRVLSGDDSAARN